MSYTLIVKEGAENDILESSLWYEKKQKFLGIKFLEEVEIKLNKIKLNPLHYQKRYKSLRLAYVKHFPYAVHYKIEGNFIPKLWKK